MTTAQRLSIRLSEIRAKLNELSALDEPTDEQRSELRKLSEEYPDLEQRHRASIIAESEQAEQRQAGEEGNRETGEGAELRRLQSTRQTWQLSVGRCERDGR